MIEVEKQREILHGKFVQRYCNTISPTTSFVTRYHLKGSSDPHPLRRTHKGPKLSICPGLSQATPPPKPVAALLSPVLWQMEHPDKFDMYSFGILMAELWTRVSPFTGLSIGQVVCGVVYAGARPDLDPPACPPAYAALVRACWAEDPNARITFSEVLSALRGMLQEALAAAG